MIVVIGIAGSTMGGGSTKKSSNGSGTTQEEKKEDFTIEGKTEGSYDDLKMAYYITGTIKK